MRRRDGIRLGRLARGDAAAVTEVFDAMSPRSRQLRFLSPVPRLTPSTLAYLVDVDGRRHIAVAAWRGQRCVGIARAVVPSTASSRATAEVAVAVVDAEHGKGVGRRLLQRLTEEAEAVGIASFEAYVDPANRPARGLLRQFGARSTFEGGLVRARWSVASARCA